MIHRYKRETGKPDQQAAMLLPMCIAFVVPGVAIADRIDRTATEILAAGSSFALWGAIAASLETLPTLRYRTKPLQQVALKAEIRFKRDA